LGFGGSSSSNTLAHTHNAALADDGGDLSETLTDMNGVVLYSLITDNSAAVAANTAAIAAISSVPSGLVAIWVGSEASIPAGWTLYNTVPATSSQTTITDDRNLYTGDRTQIGQQFNTGHPLVGTSPTKVTWYLHKTGSPTGSVNAYIENSSGVVQETSSTTLNSATLTGTTAAIEFTFAGTTALTAGDMVTVKYDSGDAANLVLCDTDNTAAVTNAVMRQNELGSWSDVAGEAATYIVTYNEFYIKKT